MKEMQDKIVKLLEGYTFREKKIALLRHEWYHPNQVTPEEMLEAMAYSRNTDGGAPVCGHISDKTYHIAMRIRLRVRTVNRLRPSQPIWSGWNGSNIVWAIVCLSSPSRCQRSYRNYISGERSGKISFWNSA